MMSKNPDPAGKGSAVKGQLEDKMGTCSDARATTSLILSIILWNQVPRFRDLTIDMLRNRRGDQDLNK